MTVDHFSSLSAALSFLLAHASVAVEFILAAISGMLIPFVGGKLIAAALPAGFGVYVVVALLLVAASIFIFSGRWVRSHE